ncbi:transglycosylase [Diaporthe eres]|uniref:Crh-like protein n=1 Tax=Diaporthe eres TaxID=83184 RepID=A0ABR1P1H8_DIAER
MHSACLITAGLSLLSAVAAQTSTECNPTEKTCGADQGLSQASYSVDFTKGASDDWNITYGSLTYDDTNGAVYTISKSGDAPTVQSNFYVFFGVVSVVMKAAPGTGIVSSAILESDDLDEIDWEWLGGTATEVETNYFGKGNTSTYDRETYVQMADSQADFHNYTIVWTKESTVWMIDGQSVRTLAYANANGGSNYPQTPMRVKLGIWAGGDPSNPEGTIQWAGGETNYDDGPFTAYIQSVSITNYNPANSYTYGDLTGSYESIVLGDTDVNTTTSSSSTGSDSSADDGSAPTSPVSPSNASGTATVRPSSSATGGASGISGSAPYSNGSSSTSPGASSATNGTGSPSPTSSSSGSSDGSSSSSSSSASGSSTAAAEASAAKLTASKAGSSVLLGVVGCALALI